MQKRCTPWWLAAVLLTAATPLARAQSTITITPGTTTGFVAAEQGQNVMPSVGNDTKSPTGKALRNMYRGSAAEYPVTCNTPGLYTIVFNGATTENNTTLAFETHPGTTNDPYGTHFTTRDIEPLASSAGAYSDYTGTNGSGLTDADGNVLTIPLWNGTNTLRIWITSTLHQPASTGYPIPDLSSSSVRPIPSGGDYMTSISSITLTRISDLPAMGTITGTVTGDKPADVKVSDALVAANPAGQAPAELEYWWKNGWWTLTKSDGTYTLSAPVGSTDVKAGRSGSYDPGGAMATVTVPSSGSVTANLQLPSIFHDDGTGHQQAFVQSEYYDAKGRAIALYNWGGHENGIGMYGSWSNNGPAWTLSYDVDAPATGMYKAGVAVQWQGTVAGNPDKFSLTTDLGSTSTVTFDTTGHDWASVYQDFPDLIYLTAGHNVLTLKLLGGKGGFDAIHLTQTDTAPTVTPFTGTVTDSNTGNPVSGATVTIGNNVLSTDANGVYKALLAAGSYPVSITAPFMDAAINDSITVIQGQALTRNYTIAIRPHKTISSSAGFTWKAALNTGGSADFRAVSADESTFSTVTVPGNQYSNVPDQSYMWYRVHFNVPTDLNLLPNRMIVLRVPQSGSGGNAISEADQAFVNGTSIGQTGAFPTTPLDPQASMTFKQPASGPIDYPAGFVSSPQQDRVYYFPASLLVNGDNVLAIKVYTNAKNGYLAGTSGIIGTPSLEVALPTATVSGKVVLLSNLTGLADVRVAAMDDNAIASDWTMTDANGNFTLTHVPANTNITIGAAKPGYTAGVASPGILANAASVTGLTLNLSAVAGPAPATIYDDFTDTTGTGWEDKWLGKVISDPKSTTIPVIMEPGSDPNTGNTIPSSITIANPSGVNWAGLVSKARISRWASVTSGRLVGLLDGTEIDVWMLGSNTTDPATLTYDYAVGFDIRPTLGGVYEASQGGQNKLLWWIRNGNTTPLSGPGSGAVPGNFAADTDITPQNPLDFSLTRTGSFWDLYLNGTRVWGGNIPIIGMGDHRISTSTWTVPSGQTWDWFAATPLALATPSRGDLNGNGIVDPGDVAAALRIVAGLATSSSTDAATANVVGSSTLVDILDAVRLMQAADGRPL